MIEWVSFSSYPLICFHLQSDTNILQWSQKKSFLCSHMSGQFCTWDTFSFPRPASHEPVMHSVWDAYWHSLLVHILHLPLLLKPSFYFAPAPDLLMIYTPLLSVKQCSLFLFRLCYKNWEASSLHLHMS